MHAARIETASHHWVECVLNRRRDQREAHNGAPDVAFKDTRAASGSYPTIYEKD